MRIDERQAKLFSDDGKVRVFRKAKRFNQPSDMQSVARKEPPTSTGSCQKQPTLLNTNTESLSYDLRQDKIF